jgi:hypothetical protein
MAVAVLVATAIPGAAATLPQITEGLSNGQACVAPSGITVSGAPWPTLAPDLEQAWQLTQGASTTVAVLDTGVAAAGAPQLAGQVTAGPAEAGPADQDCVGHGTFVASVIAARADPATGFSGVAPGSHVYALAVTDHAGNATPATIAAGINAATAQGARIIDVSIATPTSSPELASAVRDAVSAGALVVAPATIDGQTQSAPVYPAAYPGVLSVIDVGGNGGMVPGGQSADTPPITGATVALAAPGDGIVGSGIGGGAFAASGASYAAAFVAGTAALVDSYRGNLAPADLIHLLDATAVHPGTTLPDPNLGYGVVDPYAALTTVLPGEEGQPSEAAVGAARSPVVVPPPAERPAVTVALTIGGIAAGTVVFLVLGMLTVVARRRRLDAAALSEPDTTA